MLRAVTSREFNAGDGDDTLHIGLGVELLFALFEPTLVPAAAWVLVIYLGAHRLLKTWPESMRESSNAGFLRVSDIRMMIMCNGTNQMGARAGVGKSRDALATDVF